MRYIGKGYPPGEPYAAPTPERAAQLRDGGSGYDGPGPSALEQRRATRTDMSTEPDFVVAYLAAEAVLDDVRNAAKTELIRRERAAAAEAEVVRTLQELLWPNGRPPVDHNRFSKNVAHKAQP
jgi:hypothetical protein